MPTIIQGERTIPASRIHRNPDNPRFEAGDLGDLVESIREDGVLQAVLVRSAPEYGDEHYTLEIGERRWSACRIIDDNYEIPARIYELTSGENPSMRSLRIGLIENYHRANLTPLERARAYARMRDEGHMTQAEIGKSVGVHPTQVSEALMLLELTPKSMKALESGQMRLSDAQRLVKSGRDLKRKKGGHQPRDVGWEPDNFNDSHPLAGIASRICDGRGHNNRRRRGAGLFRGRKIVGACDQCWEDAIRRDEAQVQAAYYRDQGFAVPFVSPVQAAAGAEFGHNNGSNK
jgi:ParB/RepB/Spo0J family partition protein